MERRRRGILGAAALVAAGAVAGWAGRTLYERPAPAPPPPQAVHQNKGYAFINPLLECENAASSLDRRELEPFGGEFARMVAAARAAHSVAHVSVYFRDLNNGPWFGVNEQELFTPASLLKVPLLMAWMEIAEGRPDAMGWKFDYRPGQPDLNEGEYFKPANPIVPGRSYTVRELLWHLIAQSDNNAWRLLNEQTDQMLLFRILQDLDIEPGTLLGDDQTPVKTYATFFRLLYNASYLSRASSEAALELLSESEFRGGLPGDLPAEIRVAHKHGERNLQGPKEGRQLHDCGIVYHPRRPYLLCVMTRGGEPADLLGAIRQISGGVYREVERLSGSPDPWASPDLPSPGAP
jgi:beta-lactamase class A